MIDKMLHKTIASEDLFFCSQRSLEKKSRSAEDYLFWDNIPTWPPMVPSKSQDEWGEREAETKRAKYFAPGDKG